MHGAPHRNRRGLRRRGRRRARRALSVLPNRPRWADHINVRDLAGRRRGRRGCIGSRRRRTHAALRRPRSLFRRGRRRGGPRREDTGGRREGRAAGNAAGDGHRGSDHVDVRDLPPGRRQTRRRRGRRGVHGDLAARLA